ncbi:DUF2691 family protein [Ruminiclostridium papyrosolvens]|nr:DUF2691 family protein [Ruminiclostridium papyrosolvens]
MGICFEITNGYGHYLSDLLEPLEAQNFMWLLSRDEIHLLEDGEFTNEFLFKAEERIISGDILYNRAKDNTYYMVFATLKAFNEEGAVEDITNYQEFLQSDCQMALCVYDCSGVILWCKDKQLLGKMYNYTLKMGYENVKYISETELLANRFRIE